MLLLAMIALAKDGVVFEGSSALRGENPVFRVFSNRDVLVGASLTEIVIAC